MNQQLNSCSISEHQLTTVQVVAKKLSYKYTFGHYDQEDIEQEAIIIGLKALESYDQSQPLENYVYTCIKNRLVNFKRDNYHRRACDCGKCKPCLKRETKRNILEPVSINLIDDINESRTYVESEAYDIEDIQNLVDENLPAEDREAYLKIQAGVKVPFAVKKRIISLVESIIYGTER
jgi:DNA-directed RNA polymerase specialized sigma24 family protein